MSVVIIVKVSEGLVLGADSASTLSGQIRKPDGSVQEGVIKTYFNARKLLQVGDFPIGLLTWGAGYIASRTIESLVREWEYEKHWQSKKDFDSHYSETEQKEFKVKSCADSVFGHLSDAYRAEFGEQSKERSPIIGLIVAGYSRKGFFPEIWRFIFPEDLDGDVHNQRPDRDGKPDFGASWFGLTDAIARLHFGRDEQVLKIVSEKLGITPEETHTLFLPLQYSIPFPVMPLQDAIEYAHHMLNVTVGRYRFVIGPELCGGQIEIAAITQQKEFEWISRKTWFL